MYHMPRGLDLASPAQQGPAARTVATGIGALPHMAEIYPLGGVYGTRDHCLVAWLPSTRWGRGAVRGACAVSPACSACFLARLARLQGSPRSLRRRRRQAGPDLRRDRGLPPRGCAAVLRPYAAGGPDAGRAGAPPCQSAIHTARALGPCRPTQQPQMSPGARRHAHGALRAGAVLPAPSRLLSEAPTARRRGSSCTGACSGGSTRRRWP